ncbi:U32 family peptidase [Thermostichus vulcanus]|uniref:U32 family peptidase n=1 Tax=Thermostichus vulcanus str. 'Rupite' TaxID=2813851 RepID=A0ABT0CFQ6_THEVL|nr:U32 family peptidase [Thermostichus vulcanus]MCJ2544607.1 U32 family peptidase [Thermostichus vulcanus str. 'Rupite']
MSASVETVPSFPFSALPSGLPLLLAPAGDWDCAKAAVENGADAIYFGLERFNARMRARNFTEADLPELMAWLHQRGVRGYVTFNTLVFPSELTEAEGYIRSIVAAGVDAAIVQDIGMVRLIRHLSPDFPVHASTQMTITSGIGAEFAEQLDCERVVLARECSLKEIGKIQAHLAEKGSRLSLEVFVHGALCVAYSGQCLTSESLGGRSANRGECAQACRMPYDLVVDGIRRDLGEKRYLLSPQDLAGLEVLPELVKLGIHCLKIEGRLKSPEYVANVTRVYRQALDAVAAGQPQRISRQDRYELEMSFSRGLYTGWLRGINNQELVHARFSKKRGVYLGQVLGIQQDQVVIRLEAPLKAGDGVVFDQGQPDLPEQGGRVYRIQQKQGRAFLSFGPGDIDLNRIHVGDYLWKTSDPELEKRLRHSFIGEQPRHQRPVCIEVHGQVGSPLTVILRDEQGHVVQVESPMPLVAAHHQPLTTEKLKEQLGRLGSTPFKLGSLHNFLTGEVMLPVSALNQMRREAVEQLQALRAQPLRWQLNLEAHWQQLVPPPQLGETGSPQWSVLVRDAKQLQAVLGYAREIPDSAIRQVYCEFEDPRRYREVIAQAKSQYPQVEIWVAPPRITKPGETWILKQVLAAEADGYLLRNYDHLEFFKGQRCIGDFSLNVANPITAHYLKTRYNLERLTASYDLNHEQLGSLLEMGPAHWYEVTIHQHMPMFHMEHCVFCAFLSEGTDYTNCGRPCEKHEVKLRDRANVEHILKADAGCRNTLYNGKAQTGAEYINKLLNLGLRYLRIEFLQESPAQIRQILWSYQQLLAGKLSGSQLWRELKLHSQLGVTRGSLEG